MKFETLELATCSAIGTSDNSGRFRNSHKLLYSSIGIEYVGKITLIFSTLVLSTQLGQIDG